MDSNSHAESGSSSPQSREPDFDTNTPPPSSWEQQPEPSVPPHHKVKFMVSYGGVIQPRHHDIHLSYVGGHTKILYVERSITFSSLISKLSSLIDHPNALSTFKYQLPGEDLDALISVSNDEDLQHLMHEYERLYRASPKPVRFRLFLFPPQSLSGFGSGSGDSHLDPYTEALNSAPVSTTNNNTTKNPPQYSSANARSTPNNNNNNICNKVDFLFGLGSQGPVQPDKMILQQLNKLQISESYQKPTSYWQTPVTMEPPPQQQPVYVYHPPQQATAPHAPQGYYQVPAAPAVVMRQVTSFADTTTTGRQVYYAAPCTGAGLTTPFQGVPPVVVGAGLRTAGGLAGFDGKNINCH